MFNQLALNERLLKALDNLGFTEPTEVQKRSIPPALEGRDLLVCARTGSGKTAAFVLPILHRLQLSERPDAQARALILVPTRELARQVMKACEQLGRFTFIKADMIIGGEGFKEQRAMLRKNPEILIATPGRLVEHLEAESLHLNDIETLVLDEADRMLEMGFSEDLEKICNACADKRQTLLYSATLKRRGLSEIIASALDNPESLILDTPRKQSGDIDQQMILADDTGHKVKLLAHLLEHDPFDKALVFTNTRELADRLCGQLRGQGLPVGVLHGEMTQPERNQGMQLFRDGHFKVLVATDLAARGLDVKGVDLVINFDMPRNGDDYIHRIGRTGRADASGVAISLVCAYDWNLKAGIERYINTGLRKRQVEGLIASYKGPKKLKSSGKAASTKKRKPATKAKLKTGAKASGKRPASPVAGAGKKTASEQRENRPATPVDGDAPLRRKPGGAAKPRATGKPAAASPWGSDSGFEPPKRRK
ncbi:DEAD/DEAH box helicase [Aestuariirhabdus litorea]|uniref:ATP-dependent helicase n=1 Tax=Aestuariirhabdus litorea TaxID=2528527 RepID=A0A3P3VNQ7_9GAMM|nr:DEAD/DEAH box helicase [Aestuariirhabdus litorea]RRJ84392.1 ATP-dependent helicase [Aestuariirhabdus litorea]RWW97616.1 DEAD/DEAH box helicase [Endozoicomonadaceae bacterium GTF-13]